MKLLSFLVVLISLIGHLSCLGFSTAITTQLVETFICIMQQIFYI